MRRVRGRRLGLAALLVPVGTVAAIAVTGGVLVHSSVDNTFAAATVELTDDDGGAALFAAGDPDVTDMLPGQTATRCIGVVLASDATVGTPRVALHATGTLEGSTLADGIAVTVERGTVTGERTAANPCGDSFDPRVAVFDGTLTELVTVHGVDDPGADTGPWTNDPAGDEHVFRVTVQVTDTAVPGATVGPVELRWSSTTG